MDSHSNSTENLDPRLFDDSSPSESPNEEINNLINGTRMVVYDYDPSATFPEADVTRSNSINVVINYLRDAFNPTRTVDNSEADDQRLSTDKSDNDSLPVTRSVIEKPTTEKASVALSSCVAVSTCKSAALQLVYPLENVYRARYKSDYFPQNGAVRRPRYIADNAGNHFITIQVPAEYQYDFRNCYIRVALVTQPFEGHGRYYSPYKFQKDHNDIEVPDENPTYIQVDTSQEDNFTMRLQLVLIKSKSDHLNHVQPLRLFSDTASSTQIHEEKLSPKDLITRYQLDKSQIAFTLCTKLPDGSYQPNPDTTVISSVITEASTSKKSNGEAAATTVTVESTQNVYCPKCSHCFDPSTPSGSGESTEPKPTQSKTSRSRSRTSPENRSNKKKKNA